jgi:hypothetical protein
MSYFEIEAGVSAFTLEPFCAIRLYGDLPSGDKVVLIGQLSPEKVRETALNWLRCADASESDSAIFAVLKDAGLDENAIGFAISELRDKRADRERGAQGDAEAD